jgi:hypothetical protein
VIGLTCVVVPAGDFASAFADLEALEPVARVPFLALDPRREFFLSGFFRQGRIAQKKARARRHPLGDPPADAPDAAQAPANWIHR